MLTFSVFTWGENLCKWPILLLGENGSQLNIRKSHWMEVQFIYLFYNNLVWNGNYCILYVILKLICSCKLFIFSVTLSNLCSLIDWWGSRHIIIPLVLCIYWKIKYKQNSSWSLWRTQPLKFQNIVVILQWSNPIVIHHGSNTCVDVMESSFVVVLIIYKYRMC